MEKELQVIANRYGVNYRNRTEDSIFGIYGSLRFDEHTGRCVLTFQDHGMTDSDTKMIEQYDRAIGVSNALGMPERHQF